MPPGLASIDTADGRPGNAVRPGEFTDRYSGSVLDPDLLDDLLRQLGVTGDLSTCRVAVAITITAVVLGRGGPADVFGPVVALDIVSMRCVVFRRRRRSMERGADDRVNTSRIPLSVDLHGYAVISILINDGLEPLPGRSLDPAVVTDHQTRVLWGDPYACHVFGLRWVSGRASRTMSTPTVPSRIMNVSSIMLNMISFRVFVTASRDVFSFLTFGGFGGRRGLRWRPVGVLIRATSPRACRC